MHFSPSFVSIKVNFLFLLSALFYLASQRMISKGVFTCENSHWCEFDTGKTL